MSVLWPRCQDSFRHSSPWLYQRPPPSPQTPSVLSVPSSHAPAVAMKRPLATVVDPEADSVNAAAAGGGGLSQCAGDVIYPSVKRFATESAVLPTLTSFTPPPPDVAASQDCLLDDTVAGAANGGDGHQMLTSPPSQQPQKLVISELVRQQWTVSDPMATDPVLARLASSVGRSLCPRLQQQPQSDPSQALVLWRPLPVHQTPTLEPGASEEPVDEDEFVEEELSPTAAGAGGGSLATPCSVPFAGAANICSSTLPVVSTASPFATDCMASSAPSHGVDRSSVLQSANWDPMCQSLSNSDVTMQ